MQRSLSLGLQTILMRGLGTVPGPVIFGYVMDSTCLLWRHEDECGHAVGSCLIYDNAAMSLSVLGIVVAWRAIAVIVMAGALYFSKRSSVIEEEDEEDGDS